MLSNMRGKARKAVLEEAKRQMYKNTVEFREDTRPVLSVNWLYAQLNKELFNNELPKDLKIRMNGRLTRCLGKAFYLYDGNGNMTPTKIEIKKGHRWTPRFLRKIMTHEMVHIWAYQNHNDDKHGRVFWNKMKELGYPKTHCWDDAMPFEKDIYS